MIAEALSGLPTEILGHYFGKIADFIGPELTDDLNWKKWKSECGFAKNNSDFPERYAEALVELKKQEKPKSLQKFFADPSVFGLIHDFWYSGERDINKLPPVFGQLVTHFMLESEIQGFDANAEVGYFLEVFTEAVNQNETAGGADIRRSLSEILNTVKGLATKSPSQSDEYLNNSSGLAKSDMLPSVESKWINVEKLWPQFYAIPKPEPYLPRKVSRVAVRDKKNVGSYFSQPETFDLLVQVLLRGRIVLLGEAGMGKTTELDRICHELRANYGYFPIRRNFKNYDHLSTTPFFEIPQELKAWEDKVFIVLDGLDETDMVSAQNVIDKIGTEHPKSTILISCRKTAYASLPGFNAYQLERLSSQEIRNYLQENLGNFSERFTEYWANRYSWKQHNILENPFYLVRICDFFKENNWQLPNTRADIFEYLIEKSLKKRLDDVCRVGEGNRQNLRDKCRKSLEKLAFLMESMGENVISHADFQKLIPDEKEQEVLFIKSSLLETSDGKWQFVHNNIQEYLAAHGLSKASHFKVVKKTIGVKPNYRHLKHSWINTLSLLLAITSENSRLRVDLLKWLLENEPAMLIKIGLNEREGIGKAFRESAFQKEFKRCKKEDMFVGYYYWEMAEFGESESNIRFLTNELGFEITPTVQNNALVLLKDMNPGLVPDDVKANLRAQLLQIIYTPPENGADVRQYAIEAFTNLFSDLTDSEIEDIVESFFDSKNAQIRTSVYTLIEKKLLQTKYMARLIRRTEELEDEAFSEDTRLLDESWRLKRCFESLESEDEIICLFENYPIQIEQWHDVRGNLPVNQILERAIKSTLSDNGAFRILDAMKERFAEWLRYYREVEGRMVIPFVKKYGLGFKLFQYCIEKESIPNVESQLLDNECLQYLIEQFQGGDLTREYIQNLISWVAHQNESMLKPLVQRLNEVSPTPFLIPEIDPPIDFKKKKIEDLRRGKEILFNQKNLFEAIESIFLDFGVTRFEKGEVFDYNRKGKNGLPLYENYPLRLSRIIDEDTPTTRDEIVEKMTQNWEWVFVREVRQFLANHKSDIDKNSELDFTPEEILKVEKWCKDHYPKIDLDNIVTWGDITFVFFLLRYGFNGYPDKLYLDLVGHGFQYHIGSELDIFDYILSKKPHLKSQIETRVIENLKIGKAKGYEFTIHLQFVRSQKLITALPLLRNYTEGKVELDSHDKYLILEIAIELGESNVYLKNLLREIEGHQDERQESILLNHFLKKPDPEIEQILLEKLAKASGNKLRYARYLVGLGNIKGLLFFSEYARKEKKSPFQYDNFINRNLVFENLDATWEVIRLLDLGHDTSIIQNDFDNIIYASKNMLSHFATMQAGLYYEKVHRSISRCLFWHSWLNKLPSWLRKRIWVVRPETLKTLRYLLSDFEIKHFYKQKIEFSEALVLWERLGKNSKRRTPMRD